MTIRIANGYLLTPAPWLRAREPAASEPIRAELIDAAAPGAGLVVLGRWGAGALDVPVSFSPAPHDVPAVNPRAGRLLLPAGEAVDSSPHAARAARAYAAASEPLRPWAVGCCLRVQA